MKPIFTSFYLGVVLCWVGFSAHATSSHQLMRPVSSDASFEQEMIESMSKMDQDMAAAPMTGNPNHDFSAMMIPHHQGAIARRRQVEPSLLLFAPHGQNFFNSLPAQAPMVRSLSSHQTIGTNSA